MDATGDFGFEGQFEGNKGQKGQKFVVFNIGLIYFYMSRSLHRTKVGMIVSFCLCYQGFEFEFTQLYALNQYKSVIFSKDDYRVYQSCLHALYCCAIIHDYM